MTIIQMHQSFRTLCQKNGMQLVNTILPEEIDIFLNLAIIEKVREIVNSNSTSIFQDKITLRDNYISPINALRNLFIQTSISSDTKEFELDDIKAMYFISFVVNYSDDKNYKCRIIEPDKLEDTLRDFCNGASYDYPICSIFVQEDKQVCKVYNGNSDIQTLIVKYIKYPNKVSYNENINCDILEYLHGEIVQNAVMKYIASFVTTAQTTN